MANPFAIAAALSRMLKIKCPHCGQTKLVTNRPTRDRVCSKCRRHFPDPVSKKRRAK